MRSYMSVIWENIQPEIKNEVGTSAYESWFSSIHAREDGGVLILEAPDEFFKTWIEDHYLSVIRKVLAAGSEQPVPVVVTVNAALSKETISAPDSQPLAPQTQEGREAEQRVSLSLTSRFSFDNFVIGPANRFAFAACKAVAESPAKSYNPLFLYSQVGLGKTHLMQSVAHEIKKKISRKKMRLFVFRVLHQRIDRLH